MKNRKTTLAVSLVLATSLLGATAFAGTTGNEGYEAFKEVMKSNQHSEQNSGKVTGSLEIIDNGASIVKISGSVAGDEGKKAMSGNMKIISSSLEKELSLYGLNETMYIADADTKDVYVASMVDEDNERKHSIDKDTEMSKSEEALLDYFVGDLASEFELIRSKDGSYDIQLELTKNEMPALVNLITSTDFEKDHDSKDRYKDELCKDFNMEDYPLFAEFYNSKMEVTELVDNVEVEYFNATLNVNTKNELEGMALEVRVSGTDEKAQNHTISYNAEMSLSDIGKVTIAEMDLNGKNLIELPECTE